MHATTRSGSDALSPFSKEETYDSMSSFKQSNNSPISLFDFGIVLGEIESENFLQPDFISIHTFLLKAIFTIYFVCEFLEKLFRNPYRIARIKVW